MNIISLHQCLLIAHCMYLPYMHNAKNATPAMKPITPLLICFHLPDG